MGLGNSVVECWAGLILEDTHAAACEPEKYFAALVCGGFRLSCVVGLVNCELRDRHSVKVMKTCQR